MREFCRRRLSNGASATAAGLAFPRANLAAAAAAAS